MPDDTLPVDEDLGNGWMLRHLPEGSFTYPKEANPNAPPSLPTEPSPQYEERRSANGRVWSVPTPAPAKPYAMAPDLLETQQGAQSLPTGYSLNDAGIPFNTQTGKEDLPTVQRPNVLPIAMTPNGPAWAMPKMLDVASNIIGGIGAPAVATKAGEVVLGSGAVKTAQEAGQAPKFKMTPVDYDPFATDWYHGSVRIDRMDPKIDPRRATSGPMPYFTDDPGMASSYAMGKKPDTSLQAVDAGDSVANYFKVSPKDLGRTRERTPYTVEQSWHALQPEQKQEILDKYHRIGYENRDMGEGPYTLHNEPYSGLSGKDHYDYVLKNEAQGNPLKALRIIWHDSGSLINQESDLAEIYKLAGYPHKISEATAPWVEARGVMAAKLNMKNPLVTNHEKVANEVLPKLEEAFKNDRTRKPAYSNTDMWDKNYRYTPKEWVAQAKEDYAKGDNSHVWTTIPDKVTAELKKLGFDGILDTGGKGGGQAHTVAIPFDIPGIATSKYSGKTLYSDTRNQVVGKVGHDLEKGNGPFYSALERAVGDAKLGKASADQWLGYLKNQPGVKSEEINTVLKDLPEGPITKEQLQGIVKDNGVKLGEKVLGGDISEATKKWRVYDMPEAMQEKSDAFRDFEKTTKEAGGDNNDPHVIEAAQRFKRATDKVEELKQNKPVEPDPTKYHSYQLPGESSNYKETLLTLPVKNTPTNWTTKINPEETAHAGSEMRDILDATGRTRATLPAEDVAQYMREEVGSGRTKDTPFKSSHWDEPNILAHIRHNDRMVDGKKTLHLEEIQSDWHQKGRNEGYKLSDKQRKDLDTIEGKLTSKLSESEIGNPDIDNVLKVAVEKKVISADDAKNYKEYVKGENSTVPDAPFKKNWDELALKRMLHKAANEGYEGISWTPGEAQTARYDLSKQVDHIDYRKVYHRDGDQYELGIVGKNGKRVDTPKETFTAKELADTVGKEVADKIINGEGKAGGNRMTLSNLDLKIGGEGMKSFYDKMLVDKANALAKKYGSKVEQRNLGKAAAEGPVEIKFAGRSANGESLYNIYDKNGKTLEVDFKSMEAAEAAKFRLDNSRPKVGPHIHYLPITPELRAKAKQGFPLFSSVPVTVPVQGNPFEKQDKKYKLTPVQGNPFQ